MTAHQLAISKEQEQKEEARLAQERADAAKRMVRQRLGQMQGHVGRSVCGLTAPSTSRRWPLSVGLGQPAAPHSNDNLPSSRCLHGEELIQPHLTRQPSPCPPLWGCACDLPCKSTLAPNTCVFCPSSLAQVGEEAYAQQLEVENLNRQEGGVEARSVEAALEALSVVGGEAAVDKHPEKWVGAGVLRECAAAAAWAPVPVGAPVAAVLVCMPSCS